MSAATPSDIHKGGLNVSISSLGTWWRCPRLYFWSYVFPHADGSSGVEPIFTRDYLLIGSAVHAGLATYYLSGWKDGNYSLEAGLEGARSHLAPRQAECESEDKWAGVVAETERLLRNYYAEYGPESAAPEYPNLRVAEIDGHPLIEHTFSVPLRTGHILTVRPDMVAENFGQLVCLEHKVPAAQSVARTVGEAGLGGQGLAQEAVVNQFGLPANGQLLNVIVRGKVLKTRPFQRHVVAHDPWAVQQLLELAGRTVADILRAVELWEQLRDDGFQPVDAARLAFPMVGTLSGHCNGKFGPCSSYGLCTSSGRETMMLANFKQRVYRADVPAEET